MSTTEGTTMTTYGMPQWWQWTVFMACGVYSCFAPQMLPDYPPVAC